MRKWSSSFQPWEFSNHAIWLQQQTNKPKRHYSSSMQIWPPFENIICFEIIVKGNHDIVHGTSLTWLEKFGNTDNNERDILYNVSLQFVLPYVLLGSLMKTIIMYTIFLTFKEINKTVHLVDHSRQIITKPAFCILFFCSQQYFHITNSDPIEI